ncbi:MAG: hypothetical protein U9Q74_04855 [Gemmatimonadota bacterium]|nr:hypothetical protein [Gemmatimonadota bacterium]
MDFRGAITLLQDADVRFIVVGGLAATLHGSARITTDVDVLYERSTENIEKLVRALAPVDPYLRGAPPGLPFHFDIATVRAGLNFTLATTLGPMDFLGEVLGVGRYEDALPHASPVMVFGRDALVLDLSWLIRAKRAAGRTKDLEALAELELLQDPEVLAAAEAGMPRKDSARRKKPGKRSRN